MATKAIVRHRAIYMTNDSEPDPVSIGQLGLVRLQSPAPRRLILNPRSSTSCGQDDQESLAFGIAIDFEHCNKSSLPVPPNTSSSSASILHPHGVAPTRSPHHISADIPARCADPKLYSLHSKCSLGLTLTHVQERSCSPCRPTLDSTVTSISPVPVQTLRLPSATLTPFITDHGWGPPPSPPEVASPARPLTPLSDIPATSFGEVEAVGRPVQESNQQVNPLPSPLLPPPGTLAPQHRPIPLPSPRLHSTLTGAIRPSHNASHHTRFSPYGLRRHGVRDQHNGTDHPLNNIVRRLPGEGARCQGGPGAAVAALAQHLDQVHLQDSLAAASMEP
ncbi:hypothetical protein C8Q77DRAFT_1089310 [Trametes polyzona]|nr:hypothetical protein C8Q77DRAFT_1089310 [Trametes polyzona]